MLCVQVQMYVKVYMNALCSLRHGLSLAWSSMNNLYDWPGSPMDLPIFAFLALTLHAHVSASDFLKYRFEDGNQALMTAW